MQFYAKNTCVKISKTHSIENQLSEYYTHQLERDKKNVIENDQIDFYYFITTDFPSLYFLI